MPLYGDGGNLNKIVMKEFELLSLSHIIVIAICILFVIFLPRFFLSKNKKTINLLIKILVFLIFFHQFFDFYREVYISNGTWKGALPFHLCDLSAISIAIYFLTKNRSFFNFAFFWGVSGGGMSILTPDTVYGFPSIDYLSNQYGHTLTLLGISISIILLKERPYIKDIFRIFGLTTLILILIYGINNLLGSPANYWFLLEKPYGDNLMIFFPNEPFHIFALYPIALISCFIVYAPYFFHDRYFK